ncbi:MAG: UDP-2,3-diacylglucosamine diphosphatase LpxI [Desulforegulaceae bacterium]|nr:UDP-2,3-diacylglucosamine diphosphatase LpxI [Desulforegulaceae bacterium]
MNKKIGLIAGNGDFPLAFLKKAKKEGLDVFVAGFKNEASPEIEQVADKFIWIYVGQIKKIINFFKKNLVDEVVLLGGVKKTRLFFDVRPDILALKAVAKLKTTHDDNVLRAFSSIMENHGIKVCSSSKLVPEFLSKRGLWTKKNPSKEDLNDIKLGYEAAKAIGFLDIGQTVVVSGGSIVAVEAVEGTDEAIKRGGTLSHGGGVVVKTSKPNQDLRLDIPAIGPETIIQMKKFGLDVLAVEAEKTNVINLDELISLADENKISVLGIDDLFLKELKFE